MQGKKRRDTTTEGSFKTTKVEKLQGDKKS